LHFHIVDTGIDLVDLGLLHSLEFVEKVDSEIFWVSDNLFDLCSEMVCGG
jgi:hypothetical protein